MKPFKKLTGSKEKYTRALQERKDRKLRRIVMAATARVAQTEVVVIASDDEDTPPTRHRKHAHVAKTRTIEDKVTRNLKRKATDPKSSVTGSSRHKADFSSRHKADLTSSSKRGTSSREKPSKPRPDHALSTEILITAEVPEGQVFAEYKDLGLSSVMRELLQNYSKYARDRTQGPPGPQGKSYPRGDQTQTPPGPLGFLTHALQRFMLCAVTLLHQADPTFTLTTTNRFFLLRLDGLTRQLPQCELTATAGYLQDVCGPSNPTADSKHNPGSMPPNPTANPMANPGSSENEGSPVRLKIQQSFSLKDPGPMSDVLNVTGPKGDDVYNVSDEDDNDMGDNMSDAMNKNSDESWYSTVALPTGDESLPTGDETVALPTGDETLTEEQRKILATDMGLLESISPRTPASRATNVGRLRCLYCKAGGFDCVGRYICHVMSQHAVKKVMDFCCGKCKQQCVISARASLGKLSYHTQDRCLILKSEKGEVDSCGRPWLRCGLCDFRTEAVYTGDMLVLDTDPVVDHYLTRHSPGLYCDRCQAWFHNTVIHELHQSYCSQSRESTPSLEGNVINTVDRVSASGRPEIFHYMQRRCAAHNLTFTDEFQYADHALQSHLMDISGGEICRVLNLDLSVLIPRQIRENGMKLTCNVCIRQFHVDDMEEWQNHLTVVHSNCGNQCKLCFRYFKGCIKKHKRSVHSVLYENYFPCNMEGCLYKSPLYENVALHFKDFHQITQLPHKMTLKKCCLAPDCDFSVEFDVIEGMVDDKYSNKHSRLVKHYDNTHRKKLCDQCGIHVPKFTYVRHLQTHQPGYADKHKFMCRICFRCFKSKQTLQTHEIRHDERNRVISCDFCDKEFFTVGDIKSHISINHVAEANLPLNYFCEHCNKGFPRKGLLTGHLRYSSCGRLTRGESPPVPPSDAYPDSLRVRTRRLRPVMVPSEARPFCCDRCGRGFIGAYHLQRHLIYKCQSDGESAVKERFVISGDQTAAGTSYPQGTVGTDQGTSGAADQPKDTTVNNHLTDVSNNMNNGPDYTSTYNMSQTAADEPSLDQSPAVSPMDTGAEEPDGMDLADTDYGIDAETGLRIPLL